MKKRLLFVDDEPMVLQGIQRMLRPMREEWEMDFAEGGERACERVAATEYDVVITDMMMPGMDGADLLAHVKARSPKTVRIVLSGHAEQQLSLKCVGIAHQYLSKPCDAAALKATLARVTDGSFAVRNDRVMRVVLQLENLPSIPAVFCEIVRLLRDPETSMEEIGELIASDMAMTAKILKIVNSSFFGLAQRVSKPADAAAYLGLDTLKALVLATNVFSQFESNSPRGYSTALAAAHSQLVGAAARAIAQAEGAPRAVIDEALVAGFLHDVGKLILAANLPEEFQRLATSPEPTPLEAERAVFGTTHGEVGGYLLGLWGLPTAVVEAISLHHAPGETLTPKFSALTAVHVADALIAEDLLEGDAPSSPRIDAATTERRPPSDTVPGLDLEYLARLGLADRLPAWRAAVRELTASTQTLTLP
jgi:HD-like signal output (HDOD) protein